MVNTANQVNDTLGQLIREDNKSLDKTLVYEYNGIGNITAVKEYPLTAAGVTPSGTPTTTSYTYDTTQVDRLTNFGGKAITYDALGNVKTYDGWTYTWTRGRLTKMSKGNRTSGTYAYNFTYNGYGQRISKTYSFTPPLIGTVETGTVLSYTQEFSYDNSGRLVYQKKTGTRQGQSGFTEEITFLYDESSIIGMIYFNGASTVTYYFDRNIRGDVIRIYNPGGGVVAKYTYDAYGNCNIASGTTSFAVADANPIRYRGYYYDSDTRLYYLNARYYRPEWRRFISPDDTAYLDPEMPNGLNLYAYCNNDPVNKLDPSGHFVITTTMILTAIGIGAAIGAGIGFGAAYVSDVIDNIKNDGFQWSDFNTFENNWLHYVGATLGGAISGAGIGLCSVLGAGLGVALSAGTALSIGGTAISGGTALALGIGGAYVTGGLGYAVRTGISNQENFDLADMFIDATSNAISGMLTFGGALAGGIIGIKVPGSEVILKDFVLYHILAASLGVYPLKAILAFIKPKLKESN